MKVNKKILGFYVTTASLFLLASPLCGSTYASFEQTVNFDLCYASGGEPILSSSFDTPATVVAIWSGELTTYEGAHGYLSVNINGEDSAETMVNSLNTLSAVYELPDANYCTLYWGNEVTVTDENVSTLYTNAANKMYNEHCFFMEGAQFNACRFFVSLTETPDNRPVISGYEGTFATSVDNPVTTEYLKSLITAHDETDGDLTDSITITSNSYQGNEKTVGVYPISFSVSDTADNTASITINVAVVDCVLPIINGQDKYVSYMSAPITINSIKEDLIVTDNYDKDLSNSIIVVNDSYTGNENKIGNYSIEFNVLDLSGNMGTFEVSIEVVDDIKPLISGSSSYVKSTTTELSLATIKSGLSISDNVDQDISSSLTVKSDTYSANCKKAGVYNIIFTAADFSGNISNDFTVKIVVEDKLSPVFYVDNSIINTDVYTSLSNEQIIALLTKTGSIPTDNTGVSILSNTYSGNEKTPGTYSIKLKCGLADNTEKDISVDIIVNKIEQIATIDVHWYDIFIRIINVVLCFLFGNNNHSI